MFSNKPIMNEAVLKEWKDRANEAIDKKLWIESNKGPGVRPWSNNMWACFTPPSLCCMSYWCPCVTFGKTHHRLQHDGNMEGYQPCNTSCILWCLATNWGIHWVMTAMQLQAIRERHNLEGSCFRDILKACYCQPCSLVQSEKEIKEKAGFGGDRVLVNKQYAGESMVMAPQPTKQLPGKAGPKREEPKVARSEGVVQAQNHALRPPPTQSLTEGTPEKAQVPPPQTLI